MDYDNLTIQNFKAGNELAFEKIIQSEGGSFMSYIKKHIHQTGYADDVYQDACLKIWKNRSQLNNIDSFRGWAYQIVRSSIYDFLRSRDWRLNIEFFDEEQIENCIRDTSYGPRKLAELSQLASILNSEINRLSDEEREIILLRFNGGLKLREISAALNIPRGTVSERIKQSMIQLRRKLKKYNLDLSVL